jgi:hypothetical protein
VAEPTILRGRILAYRVFDAGDTIALDVAEKRLDAKRVSMGGPQVEGLVIPVRPLEVPIAGCTVTIGAQELTATCTAHVFDFGAVSFVYDIPIERNATLSSITPLCDALYDAPELTKLGTKHREELLKRLGDAVENPHAWADAETYTIIFVEEIAGCALEELSKSEAVAKLLLGETTPKALSQAVKDDVLKNSFSYLVDDLVVIDWNSALVVEPSGSRIVPFVLELATSQLLEFRYYDLLVDRELARVYEYVEKVRPRRLIRSPYGAATRKALEGYMELTEFTERVDNAIKSVGDFWLARVYRSAINRFRVPEWRESVEAKLQLVGRAYEMLKGEVEVSRGQVLEIIVIALILVELLAALRGHG